MYISCLFPIVQVLLSFGIKWPCVNFTKILLLFITQKYLSYVGIEPTTSGLAVRVSNHKVNRPVLCFFIKS